MTMPVDLASDTWESGDPYEQYVGRWSRRVAPRFLSWLNVPAGQRWVDVGCGTGALCAAILDGCSPSALTGVEPSEGFLKTAQSNLAGRATLVQGTAAAIPLDDQAADVVVSGLVLNFVPDVGAALAEMARVLSSGGHLGGYVWDYSGKMELIRRFWDAVVELVPEAAKLHEGVRFPLCQPEALLSALRKAGLRAPETTAIDVRTDFASFDDYWSPFLGGQGPAPAYAMSLGEAARARLRGHLRERLPIEPDGSASLVARAWAFRASVA
jgi:SAM-dependent methyltransferase